MTGRQGHNAIPGQQGFQRVRTAGPDCAPLGDADDAARWSAIADKIGLDADAVPADARRALMDLDAANDEMSEAISALHAAGGPVSAQWRSLDAHLVQARTTAELAFVRFAEAVSPSWRDDVALASKAAAEEASERCSATAASIDEVCDRLESSPASKAPEIVESSNVRYAFSSSWRLPSRAEMVRNGRDAAAKLRESSQAEVARLRAGLDVAELARHIDDATLRPVVQHYGSTVVRVPIMACCEAVASSGSGHH